MDTNNTTAPLHRQVESRLSEQEIRYTTGRRTVVNALAEADGPLSVAELADRLGTVPMSSIYRTISVFEDAGVVTHHLATREMARYELAEWLQGHHHHLVCIDCGRVDDIELADPIERSLENVVQAVAATTEFQPTNHALEIEGRCKECA